MQHTKCNSGITSSFVDVDHDGCNVTRRSHTGVLIFVNRALVLCLSKRQNTVEVSIFELDYITIRQSIDYSVALIYKIIMVGIPFEGSINVFCDNNDVVINSIRLKSTLKCKHNSVAYHRVGETQAGGIVRITRKYTDNNLIDMLTKLIPDTKLRKQAVVVIW